MNQRLLRPERSALARLSYTPIHGWQRVSTRDCHTGPKVIAPRTRQRECGSGSDGEPGCRDAVNRWLYRRRPELRSRRSNPGDLLAHPGDYLRVIAMTKNPRTRNENVGASLGYLCHILDLDASVNFEVNIESAPVEFAPNRS